VRGSGGGEFEGFDLNPNSRPCTPDGLILLSRLTLSGSSWGVAVAVQLLVVMPTSRSGERGVCGKPDRNASVTNGIESGLGLGCQ
jgi:hypothetical protein